MPRRRKLHITCGSYALPARSFRCSSFPHQTRWRWALVGTPKNGPRWIPRSNVDMIRRIGASRVPPKGTSFGARIGAPPEF